MSLDSIEFWSLCVLRAFYCKLHGNYNAYDLLNSRLRSSQHFFFNLAYLLSRYTCILAKFAGSIGL